MDKKECLEVIELLSVSWDKPMDQTTLTARAKAFYEYIGDLPAAAVAKVIKDMAVAGRQWAPRPGELRVEAIAMMQEDALPPSAPEAWSQLQTNRAALYNGTAGTDSHKELHEVLKITIRKLGNNRAQDLTTNGDRDMFTSLYEKEREAWILNNYGFDTKDAN